MFEMMPFEYSNDLLDSFADFEKKFFGEMGRSFSGFNTDIQDTGKEYILEAELPGFNKEDIHVDVQDGVLTISAKHEEKQDEKDEKSGKYVRRERRYGSYQRSFNLNGVDAKNIQGAYENGVLKLTLPKEQPTVPETHRIEIK